MGVGVVVVGVPVLQSLVATAQWVARVVALKKQQSNSNGFTATLTYLVKLYL